MTLDLRARDSEAWDVVLDICRRVVAADGRAHLVGGSVRDALLKRVLVDFDLEVFGLKPDRLQSLLSESYRVDRVGEAFGVLKVMGWPIDVALPRRESKIGDGHRAFEIRSDPDLSPEQAAIRRDFTVNSIAYDPLRDLMIDPLGGASDLEARRLRHTSPHFIEDPLRVLRGMQLAARFELEADSETVALCRTVGLEGLAPERLFEEWRKLLLLGLRPRMGLDFLRQTGWLQHFPELEQLVGCEQDPEWHPEGDVWDHTLHVMDAFAAARIGEEWEDLVVGFACLCHDLGKPATSRIESGRIRSKGHEQAGEQPTRSFLTRLTRQSDLVEQVVPLVLHHLKPRQLFVAEAGDAAVRRLARKVGRIDRLVRVARADAAGRPPLSDSDPAGEWLLSQASALAVADSTPKPILGGRHLIERGLEPGPRFGELLEQCFEAQLDGRFSDLDGGLRYLSGLLAAEQD